MQFVQQKWRHQINVDYKNLTKEELLEYIKKSSAQRKHLLEREESLKQQIQELTLDQEEETIDEKIRRLSLASPLQNEMPGSGHKVDKDKVHRIWEQAYQKQAERMDLLHESLMKVYYEQFELESLQRCIDQLPEEEQSLIMSVFVQHHSIKEFCVERTFGHSRFYWVRDRALELLLVSFNNSRKELHDRWMKEREKMFDNTGSLVHTDGIWLDRKN